MKETEQSLLEASSSTDEEEDEEGMTHSEREREYSRKRDLEKMEKNLVFCER